MRLALAFLVLSAVVSQPARASSVPGALLQHSGGHTIRGIVREEGTNAPISAVALQLLSSGNQASPSVTSGMEGEFSFTSLPDGDYSIVANKTGYDPVTVGVTVMRTGTSPVTILLHRTSSSRILGLGNPISARELGIPQRARTSYEKGRALLEDQKNPAGSIPEFEQAAKAFASYYEAYTQIGVANFQLGKFPESEVALKKAIELSSGKYLQPLYLLADLYNSERRYPEAESLARQATTLDEATWNGHFELARALVGQKRGPEAETSALRARELKPDSPPVHLVLANAHLLEQNFAAAIQDFDTYLSLEPSGPLSEAVRQNRERLQRQLQQPSDSKQVSPPPANLQKP